MPCWWSVLSNFCMLTFLSLVFLHTLRALALVNVIICLCTLDDNKDQFKYRGDVPVSQKAVVEWMQVVEEVMPGLVAELQSRMKRLSTDGCESKNAKENDAKKQEDENMDKKVKKLKLNEDEDEEKSPQIIINNLKNQLSNLTKELEKKDKFFIHKLQELREKHDREIMIKNAQIKSMDKRINSLTYDIYKLQSTSTTTITTTRIFSPSPEPHQQAQQAQSQYASHRAIDDNHGGGNGGGINRVSSNENGSSDQQAFTNRRNDHGSSMSGSGGDGSRLNRAALKTVSDTSGTQAITSQTLNGRINAGTNPMTFENNRGSVMDGDGNGNVFSFRVSDYNYSHGGSPHRSHSHSHRSHSHSHYSSSINEAESDRADRARDMRMRETGRNHRRGKFGNYYHK